MQEHIEAPREFVVAGGDTTKLPESVEESLNEIARLVSLPGIVMRATSIASRWNDGLGSRGLEGVYICVAVVTLVSDDGISSNGRDQGRPLGDVRNLAGGENQSQRIAQGIYAGVNLCRQPTPRAAARLIATVYFGALAECWWARTTVESMSNSPYRHLPGARLQHGTTHRLLPTGRTVHTRNASCCCRRHESVEIWRQIAPRITGPRRISANVNRP